MVDALPLDFFEYKKFLTLKNTLEKEYGVEIMLPEVDVNAKDYFSNEVFIAAFNGPEAQVQKAIEHAKNTLAPEEEGCFVIPQFLTCIFKDSTWLRIISNMFDVNIKVDEENIVFQLSISGNKCNIQSALTEMAKLEILFDKNKENCKRNKSCSKISLPSDLSLPPQVIKAFNNVQNLPVNIQKTLLQWIESTFRNVQNMDDSVVVLNDSHSCLLNTTIDITQEPSIIEIEKSPSRDQDDIIIIDCEPAPSSKNNKRKRKRKKKQLLNELNKKICTSSSSEVNNVVACNTKKESDEEIIFLDTKPGRSDSNISNIPKQINLFANRKLRPVVIDGSNVAFEHGKGQKVFSCNGIQLSIEFFLKRGHKNVVAFVPQYRRGHKPNVRNPEILEKLYSADHLVFTPSRRINGKSISSYDDRFIVKLATENKGIILSNDNYRDLLGESKEWKETIENRLLMYCFVGDMLMIPDDPLGKNGPRLEEFLSFPESEGT